MKTSSTPQNASLSRLICLGFLAALLLGGCSRSKAPGVIATVGKASITPEDFQEELERESRGGRSPDRHAVLNTLVSNKLVVAQALASGLDRDPVVLKAYESALTKRIRSLDLQPRLAQIRITSEAILEAYQTQQSRYILPAESRLAMLYLQVSPKASAEEVQAARARLEEARQQVIELPATEKGFGPLAIHYSDDQATRYKGGELGWFGSADRDRSEEEVVRAGLALSEIGAVSPILNTPTGLCLVRLMDRKPPRLQALDRVAPALSNQLYGLERARLESSYFEELKKSHAVEVNEAALSTQPLSPAWLALRPEKTPGRPTRKEAP